MTTLYPLKFKTIYKDKIWGGNKIKSELNKDYSPLRNCGETWEISGVKGNISVVREGNLEGRDLKSLISEYKQELVGERIFQRFGVEFPLLVKFIDAHDDLSVQVHPNDELARKRHNSMGKNEMWYIIQADQGAKLIAGFNQPVTKEKYQEYFNQHQIMELLNHQSVFHDDVFYIPAGRIHTIGKGILLAEIQQTSDVTYRIYDFDRKDQNGNERELHVEEALDAIDYNYYSEYKTVYDHPINQLSTLVKSPYFTTNRIYFDQPTHRDYSHLDSFVIYTTLQGSLKLIYDHHDLNISKGDAVLLPACINKVKLESSAPYKILESYIE